jgi:hypothetical protein
MARPLSRRLAPALVCLLALGRIDSLEAWDAIGHLLIDQVAVERLKPTAREKLGALAAEIEFPGINYNTLTIGCWMDDIRTNREDVPFHGRFKPWHYIDIGLFPGDPVPSFTVTDPMDEKAGNVVQALQRAVAVLRGGTDPLIPSPAVAVAMIAHLVGDIHQPLHCAAYYYPGADAFGRRHDDRGGNEVSITNSEERPGRLGPEKLNLHAFWDSAYRADFQHGQVVTPPLLPEGPHAESDEEAYRFDFAAYAPGPEISLRADFPAWALESNRLARDDIYDALPFDRAHRQTSLTEADVAKARDLARRRLVLAGERLAQLLNDLLAPGAAPAGT